MTRGRRVLIAVLGGLERVADGVAGRLGAGRGAPPEIVAHAGYRDARRARIGGRVVRRRPRAPAGSGTLARIRAMLAIYNSHEVPGVRVRCAGFGVVAETVSDAEGYFSFELAIDRPLPPHAAWEPVGLSLAGAPPVEAPVLAPGADQRWAIISDIDDTVVETGATNFVRNWKKVLMHGPAERVPVPGAADLYRLLAVDARTPARPFFYVSSSPWNLYGFIAEFMALNGIPNGPMFLTDYGIDAGKLFKAGHAEHKLAAIETVLGFYPGTRFLLIGDNGQADVEIYARAVRDYPGRVGAVFIRDIGGQCAKGAKAARLAQIEAAGVPTFCGAGFADALAVVRSLDLDRPAEAAKAVAAAPA